MPKKEISAPLVGMRFRPPALTILQGLGMDQELVLLREPSNPYDENAIQVWLPKDWVDDKLELAGEARAEAQSAGNEEVAQAIFKGEPFFLGFIARDVAAIWSPVLDKAAEAGQPFPPAKLSFSSSGAPLVVLEIEIEDDTEELFESIASTDGAEIHKDQWALAEKLVGEGKITLGPARGPDKAWRRAELVKEEEEIEDSDLANQYRERAEESE